MVKVSRIVGQRPLELIRCRAWTAAPTRFGNGISAVTSLCLVDESSAGGPPLLIAGDEDGGVSVQRVPATSENRRPDNPLLLATPKLRRTRLHNSGVNAIKVLPDQRGFVCAGDDGVVSAVATLEASSEGDLRRATFALSGHSGFVTDCDTAARGHAILSSSTDGKMLLWDPVAANTPVASVSVGRPVNSACFSAGDPYALICAPEFGGASCSKSEGGGSTSDKSGNASDDLVQIWDLRSLRCFRDNVPANVATAFGEAEPAPIFKDGRSTMQPPPPQSPQSSASAVSSIWEDVVSPRPRTTRSTAARTPAQASWLKTVLGSTPAASPATPILRRYAWSDESSDNESLPSGSIWPRGRSRLWSCRTPESAGKENDSFHFNTPDSGVTARGKEGGWLDTSINNSSARSGASNSCSSPGSWGGSSGGVRRGSSKPTRTVRRTARDGPAGILCSAALPISGCLHEGEGKTWIPGGGLMSWQPSKRRARAAVGRRRRHEPRENADPSDTFASTSSSPACGACMSGRARAGGKKFASVYAVQVSSDGRGILMASRDATVTLWDAQSREVVYRFGHARLSMRARPILSEDASNGEGAGWGRAGSGRGDVFAGTKDGEVRAWRVGSQFPNRVFKTAQRHEGFEVICVATSRAGEMFASADSSGQVCVQSATARRVGADDEERGSI